MNGLYLHIPICARRCAYCDFYSTVEGAEMRERFVTALCREIQLRAPFLPSAVLHSVYLGGGTPSQLNPSQLSRIFRTIGQRFSLAADAEVTLEVNPDDIAPTYLKELAKLPVNRLSMGIQTFDDRLLRLLNRRHTARQARRAFLMMREAGFSNISVDLMYGLPDQTVADWERDVDEALSMGAAHLSAYALTYEEGTALERMRRQGQVREADEELSRQMYELLLDTVRARGWEHYEISNFCLPGCRARHNSGYWNGMNYLGCGPGAHSYDGAVRRWNTADLTAYVSAGGDVDGRRLFEEEVLTPAMRADEMVMTRLRTADGLSLAAYGNAFGAAERAALTKRAQEPLQRGWLARDAATDTLRLTRQGLFLSDGIMADLMPGL